LVEFIIELKGNEFMGDVSLNHERGNSVLGAVYDFILNLLIELNPECAVAGHPDRQVALYHNARGSAPKANSKTPEKALPNPGTRERMWGEGADIS
jgi:hypothetical protein